MTYDSSLEENINRTYDNDGIAEFGEGSFDKGFYFYIPIETFFERYSKGNTGFGLRPITRDGAAYLSHGLNLYGVTDQAVSSSIYRDIDDIYD